MHPFAGCISFRQTEWGPPCDPCERMFMRKLYCAAMLVALFVTSSCGASTPTELSTPDTGFHNLGDGNTDFAFALYGELCSESGDDNIMFSPFCISSALGMAWAGARGETEAAMAAVLGFDADQQAVHNGFRRLFSLVGRELCEPVDDPVVLNMANALWVDGSHPLLDDYTDLVSEYYRAEARNVDFEGDPETQRLSINDWVGERTENRILDLLGPGSVTTATRVVLTSAVYFKGNWRVQFNPDLTRDGTFTTLSGEEVEVPFMSQTQSIPFHRGDGFRAAALPYSDGSFRLILLLPDGDLEEFEQSLDRTTLEAVIDGFQPRDITLVMPPFEFDTDYSLTPVLSAMGMDDAFDASRADFSGFTGDRDLFISAVVHKAYVRVDETGTEAAAATGVVMAMTAMPADPPELFLLNRPFVFLIVDDMSGAVLFMGRVADPSI